APARGRCGFRGPAQEYPFAVPGRAADPAAALRSIRRPAVQGCVKGRRFRRGSKVASGVDIGHRPQYRIRPAMLGQTDALARQPFEVAVLANMNHCVGAVAIAQPEIERQIAVGWHQIGVVVNGAVVNVVASRRLDPDEGHAQAQAGDHHSSVSAHGVEVWRSPACGDCLAIGSGQRLKRCQVLLHRQALVARPLVEAVRVVGDATKQGVNQRSAGVGQVLDRVALALHRAQNVQRRRRGVEPYAVADATVTGGVIGEDQRHALVDVGGTRQKHPASGQFGNEVHPLRLCAMAHHIGLAALAAPRQVFEADGATDDAAVQFRQRDVHGQVARAETLGAGPPRRFVVLGADGLNHRNVAAKRTHMGRVRAGLGEPGGIKDDFAVDLIHPALHGGQA
nr:hypothetical protein [Tanacetum cinerariifolium]